MVRREIWIATPEGKKLATAFGDGAGGLTVSMADTCLTLGVLGLTITHELSGYRMGAFRTLTAAEAARAQLLALPVDWTASYDSIVAAVVGETRQQVQAILATSDIDASDDDADEA